MKKELEFILIMPAQKSGGDRYEHGMKNTPEHMVLYLPQYISREEGIPYITIKITIEA